jgi:hypothetical protein
MLKINDFEKVKELGPINKFAKTVQTPGYPEDQAESRTVIYEAGDRYYKVCRVSTLGWNVTEYDSDRRPIRRASSENLGYIDTEDNAHDLARKWVKEYATNE